MDDDLSVLGGLLGLGTSVAGLVPSLLPGQSEEELSRIAGGAGGAGAQAVRQSTEQAARDALSIAGSGRGATRGLQLREALRQADRIRGEGVSRAASMAAREQQSALGSLEAVRQRRLQALARGGAALGQGLSALGATSAVAAGGADQPGSSTGALPTSEATPTPPPATASTPGGIVLDPTGGASQLTRPAPGPSGAAGALSTPGTGITPNITPAAPPRPDVEISSVQQTPAGAMMAQIQAFALRAFPNDPVAQQNYINSQLPFVAAMQGQ